MQSLPFFPVYLVDFVGSFIMVLLSFKAFSWALKLKRSDPHNVLFMYLFGLSSGFVAFSLSRSAGHMLRFIFVYAGVPNLWNTLSPLSGSLNTVCFIFAASLTFIYPYVRKIIDLVQKDAEELRKAKEELEKAHDELQDLYYTLEDKVRQRTQELLASEQKFRRFFEASGDAIFFCDAKAQITDINPSGVQMLGFSSKEEIIGVKLSDLFVDPEDWQRYVSELCGQGSIKNFETCLRRKDGSKRYVIISANAIEYEKECKLGCEGIAKDITQFKKMTEKLIYSEKMASLGQLAAGVAHEINTPLGIILGYAQLLKEEFPLQKELIDDLDIIENQAKICKKIVSDLLSFARSSTPQADKEPLSINECIQQTVDMVRHTFEMDDIHIFLHFKEDIPVIYADHDRCNQVIINFLNNSRDAIGKGGEIHIWTDFDLREGYILIEIGDTGVGIPPEIKDRIFDPFFTTKPSGQGTGLGLSVSYGIIEELGGTIEVYSPPEGDKYQKLGINTLFKIYLPLDDHD